MDLKDQLKQLFPEHTSEPESNDELMEEKIWISDETIECHYEKRNGKPTTIIRGYTGNDNDFKKLAKDLKKYLGVGGSAKSDEIILQGDYRERIMKYLKDLGMTVKRVGG